MKHNNEKEIIQNLRSQIAEYQLKLKEYELKFKEQQLKIAYYRLVENNKSTMESRTSDRRQLREKWKSTKTSVKREIIVTADVKYDLKVVEDSRRDQISYSRASLRFKNFYRFPSSLVKAKIPTAPNEIVEILSSIGTLKQLKTLENYFPKENKNWIDACDEIVNDWLDTTSELESPALYVEDEVKKTLRKLKDWIRESKEFVAKELDIELP